MGLPNPKEVKALGEELARAGFFLNRHHKRLVVITENGVRLDGASAILALYLRGKATASAVIGKCCLEAGMPLVTPYGLPEAGLE